MAKETPSVGITIGRQRSIVVTTQNNLALEDHRTNELTVLGAFTQGQAENLSKYIKEIAPHLPKDIPDA